MSHTLKNYRAEPCPCRHETCPDWHVSGVAAMQGVCFTQEQAKLVADVLNHESPQVWVIWFTNVHRHEEPYGFFSSKERAIQYLNDQPSDDVRRNSEIRSEELNPIISKG